jgi:hypothetical protein
MAKGENHFLFHLSQSMLSQEGWFTPRWWRVTQQSRDDLRVNSWIVPLFKTNTIHDPTRRNTNAISFSSCRDDLEWRVVPVRSNRQLTFPKGTDVRS